MIQTAGSSLLGRSDAGLSAEALHRLESARQEWHADLDTVLCSNFAANDHELAISLARCAVNPLPLTYNPVCDLRVSHKTADVIFG